MKRHLTPHILLPLLALLLGCNSDIFVDSAQLPESTDIHIEAIGTTSLYYPTDDLEHIRVRLADENAEYITYYGKDNQILTPDSPAADIREITFDDVISSYAIGLHGNYIYFNSYCNCTGTVKQVTLQLQYTYGVRDINFFIDRGEDLIVLYATYDGELQVTPDVEHIRRTFSFNNSSTLTQWLDWQPYEEADANAILEPSEWWAKYCEVPLPLPVMYSSDEWGTHDDGYILPCFTWFRYPPLAKDKVVRIEIPPMTTLRLTSTVSYSEVIGHGSIDLINPATDTRLETSFTCTAHYPASYEIETVYEQ